MTSSKVPYLDASYAVAVIERDGRLVSPRLAQALAIQLPHEHAMQKRFYEAQPGSLEEMAAASQLADLYHLQSAQRVQTADRPTAASVRNYNQQTVELYGEVDPIVARGILAEQRQEIEKDGKHTIAASIYRHFSAGVEATNSNEQLSPAMERFREAVHTYFADIIEVVQSLPDNGPYPSSVVRDIFEKIVAKLSEKEPAWLDWSVTNDPNKAMLSVTPARMQIDVPDKRAPVATKSQLLGLAIHEIGVHAQRSVRGSTLDDEMMRVGLPRYSDYEEGLGVLVEYLVTGVISDKIKDRYVDLALASGALDGVILTRPELTTLNVSREEARATARGVKPKSEEEMLQTIVPHVDRFFRGTNGLPVRDENNAIVNQPYYTRDLSYLQGFLKAKKLIESLPEGVNMLTYLDFLISGKFDAGEPAHLAYIRQKHGFAAPES